MTVSNTGNKARFSGNNITTEFSANIKILAETDITVRTLNDTTDAVVNTLLLNDGGALGYTVAFDTEDETLTVTVNTAPTSSEDLQIIRSVPQSQATDFSRASKFPSVSVENALDKTILILQDQQEQLDRSITLPSNSSLASVELPTPTASSVLGWNATADAIVNYEFADLSLTLDTVFTGLAANDFMRYDGSNWVNITTSTLKTSLSLGSLADSSITNETDATITASDELIYADVSDSNNIKKDTVQGIIDLVPDSITLLTEQATTSGTSFDFTIPSGAKRVTIMLEGTSLSGTDDLFIQLGDSGGIETSSYVSRSENSGGGTVTSTSAFVIDQSNGARVINGYTITLNLKDSANFTWICSGNGANDTNMVWNSGAKSLSAELTTVRLTRSGTDTFDAGSVNVSYEM